MADTKRLAPETDTLPVVSAGTSRRTVLIQGSLAFLFFLVIFAGYGLWIGSRFLNVDARLLDAHQSVPVLLLALAVLVTLVSGLFDLSVASVATLSMFLAIGLTVQQGWPLPLALLACILLGAVVGFVNAFLVERLGVNTFIATLGTGSVIGGIAAVYSGGSAIVPGPDSRLPAWFLQYGSYMYKPPLVIVWLVVLAVVVAILFALDRFRPARIKTAAWWGVKVAIVAAIAAIGIFLLDLPGWFLNLSWSITFLLVIAVVVWVLLDRTVFGRNLYAIGSNREAARLAGVHVSTEIGKGFILGGVLAALAGVTFAASAGSATPDAAAGYLLPAFSAAFLSTVIFSTGRFTVLGAIVGGIFIVWTGIGLVVGGLPNTWTNVVNGVVLLLAVAFATFVRRRGK